MIVPNHQTHPHSTPTTSHSTPTLRQSTPPRPTPPRSTPPHPNPTPPHTNPTSSYPNPIRSWLGSVVERFLPPPVRLTQCWCKRSKGQRQLYAWEAVPPEGFVALGMLCSTSEVPPPIESIRCVPRSWVRPSHTEPQKVWDDSGSSGTQGSIWVVNNLRLIAVTAGHEPPAGPFYEFMSDRSFLSELVSADTSAGEES